MKNPTNKVLKLCTPIESIDVKSYEDSDEEELLITGHASTNDVDRSGDIIVSDAWTKSGALDNYLKNPIILAFHDMARPIGKAIDHSVDDQGLKITAKISKAAGDIATLIKEGILSAFSVGFMIKDADFDTKSGQFYIKELELYEISVVSVPANQDTLFSIGKNFSSDEEFLEFKKQFIKEDEETLMKEVKETETPAVDLSALAKEISSMVKSDLEAEQKAKAEAEARETAEKEAIRVEAKTAAESLIEDLKKEIVEKETELGEALEGIRSFIKEQQESGELQKTFQAQSGESKMKFTEQNRPGDNLTIDQKDGLILASKIFSI